MSKYRFIFSKMSRAVWISHLDLMHTLQRGFSRADVEIEYSEGFNPHPIMSIALPLGVGVESECEVLDIKLKSMCEVEKINNCLPEGIRFISCYEPQTKASEIKWLEIEGHYEYADADSLNEFFKRDSIVISKKSKRGISDVDIKPMIKKISFSDNMVKAVISAQEPTLNPNNILDALNQLKPDIAPDYIRFKRVKVYTEEMAVFK